MNYLAIDTSGKNLLIVLNKNGNVFSVREENCMEQHSVTLIKETERLLTENGLTLFDMDFFVVVVGPGSFTGIRIGVATVKAFSLAVNKPVLKITSFDTITYNKGIGRYLAVIDAKHDNFYAQGVFDRKTDFGPAFISLKELKELEKEYRLISFDDIPNSEKTDTVEGLVRAVEAKNKERTFDLDAVRPLYIRKSQAEENR